MSKMIKSHLIARKKETRTKIADVFHRTSQCTIRNTTYVNNMGTFIYKFA